MNSEQRATWNEVVVKLTAEIWKLDHFEGDFPAGRARPWVKPEGYTPAPMRTEGAPVQVVCLDDIMGLLHAIESGEYPRNGEMVGNSRCARRRKGLEDVYTHVDSLEGGKSIYIWEMKRGGKALCSKYPGRYLDRRSGDERRVGA